MVRKCSWGRGSVGLLGQEKDFWKEGKKVGAGEK